MSSDSAYHIVLSKIREGSNNSQIAAKLGQAFSMPGNRVNDAMQRIPVVLFESLDRSQADGMKDTLRDLAQLGIDFKITRKIEGISSAAWPLGGEPVAALAVSALAATAPPGGEEREPGADDPLTIGSVNFSSPSGLETFRIDFKIYLIEGALGAQDRAALTVDTAPLGGAATTAAPARPTSSTTAARPVSEVVRPLGSETVQAATPRPSTAEAKAPAGAAKAPAVAAHTPAVGAKTPAPASKPAPSRYEDEDVEELEELEELDDLEGSDDGDLPPDSESELEEIGDDIEELTTQDELPGDEDELEELRDLDADGGDESTSDELAPLAGDEDDVDGGDDRGKAYAEDRVSVASESADAEDLEELDEIEELDDDAPGSGDGELTDSVAADEDLEDLEDLEELEDVEELEEAEDEPEADGAEDEDLEELDEIDDSADEPDADEDVESEEGDADEDLEELDEIEELDDEADAEDDAAEDDAAEDEDLEELDEIEELEDDSADDSAGDSADAEDDDDLEELEELEDEDEDLAPMDGEDLDDERTIIDDGQGGDDFEVEGDLEDIDEIDDDDDAPRGKSAKGARPGFGKKGPEPKKPAVPGKAGVKPDSVEGISVVQEELKPWTGRARDYTHAGKGPGGKGGGGKDGRPGAGKADAKGATAKGGAGSAGTGKVAGGPGKGAKPSKGGEGSGDYSLFLSKIKNKDKKFEAARIIAEVTGCTEPAAVEMCDRMIISVIKGSTKEYADEVLAKFTAIGVAGRVTAKK